LMTSRPVFMRSTFVLTLLASVSGFNTPSGAFATFGNAQAKEFIRLWQPQPLKVPEGTALLPSSTENMKRYVRARILLEDAGVGCIASFDDGLCVFLCRFTKAEHSLLLPLWQPAPDAQELKPRVFSGLQQWHMSKFDDTRLSGTGLEWGEDKQAWFKSMQP